MPYRPAANIGETVITRELEVELAQQLQAKPELVADVEAGAREVEVAEWDTAIFGEPGVLEHEARDQGGLPHPADTRDGDGWLALRLGPFEQPAKTAHHGLRRDHPDIVAELVQLLFAASEHIVARDGLERFEQFAVGGTRIHLLTVGTPSTTPSSQSETWRVASSSSGD